MFNDDLKNDAIDAQIQQGIGRLRGDTLNGMVHHAEGSGEMEGDHDADDSITKQMIAEDEAAEAAKKNKGGGMGGIMDMVGSFAGG